MSPVGTFKLNRTFNLTGRGLVLIGELLYGCVDKGYFISLPIEVSHDKFKIISIEAIDNKVKNNREIALIIQPVSPESMLAINASLEMTCAILKQTE